MYSKSSTASGALFSFVFITDSGDVDFSRSFFLALDRNTSHNYTLPFDLYPGHYRVHVYDIERDGTLHNGVGYPAVTEELFTNFTNNGNDSATMCCYEIIILLIDERSLHPFNCTVYSTSGLIWAECSYPCSSFAAGIQVIVQSTNVSEVHKLYVNQSMDLHTPVTVPVERGGEYRVSIFAIRNGTGILGSTVQYMMVTVRIFATPSATTTDVSTHSQSYSAATSGIFFCFFLFVCFFFFSLSISHAVCAGFPSMSSENSRYPFIGNGDVLMNRIMG